MSSWSQGALFMVQLMMNAENRGSLIDGWHLIFRLHILARNFDTARKNEADWNASQADLGFSLYDQAQANSIDNNDWLLIAVGKVTNLDFRKILHLWGLSTSTEAQTQIASLSYSAVPAGFYLPTQNNAYCKSLNQPWQAL